MADEPDLPPLPPRPPDAHKGTFGTVTVVGGAPTMIGAPCLVAAGALRIGCGLVRMACPTRILMHCLAIEPSAIGVEIADDLGVFLNERAAVLAVGPGLGQGERQRAIVAAALASANPLVLDADGLNALAMLPRPAWRRDAPWVLTPHPGEFRRLAAALGIASDPGDPAGRAGAATALATATGAVVVLKGRQSVIADRDGRVALNRTGNPALAIPGSGDVLTGVIAGLVAQGLDGWDAARLGAHLHGLAGDLWAQRVGPFGLVAIDLARLVPEAMRHYFESRLT